MQISESPLAEAGRRYFSAKDAETWIGLLHPGFHLRAVLPDESVAGYLGGDPLLPPDIAWPEWEDHGPLNFIAAIDCSQVLAQELDIPLPESGEMLFFYYNGLGDSSVIYTDPDSVIHGTRVIYVPASQHLTEIDRMRSDLTLDRIRHGWTSWRGRAIEPLVRESLARLLSARGIPVAPAVGSYWTRSNDVEIDIVGGDREPIAKELLFLGSVKWLENSPFDNHDLVALQRHRDRLTRDPITLIAVTRLGASTDRLDAVFEPDELLESWLG